MAADYSAWIDRETIRHDVVTERTVVTFNETLRPHLFTPVAEQPGTLGLHWCVAPAIHPPENLGPDGAERKGLFLPPIPLPRRMWAGGELEIFAPIAAGDMISRHSRVGEVSERRGASGPLCIVPVHHDIHAAGVLAVRERHDILFRGEAVASAPKSIVETRAPAHALWHVEASSLLLLRFSALTFNGHRIHYDLPYARDVEGYGGLLVHGPLQALLALNQAAILLGQAPRRFIYRCLAPLLAPQVFTVESTATELGVETALFDAAGVRTLAATATA